MSYLDRWGFDNFTLADEVSARVLRSLEIFLLVNNSLCGSSELVSLLELPITFDERFKVTSVLFLIPDFNLLSC